MLDPSPEGSPLRPARVPVGPPVRPGGRAPVAPLILLGAVLAACGGDGRAAARAEVQDSAGVPVVVSPGPDADSPAAWRISPEPLVEIGVVEGAPEDQLFGVSGGAVLSDGTIVVGNAGTRELRFYDGAGRHLRTAGREGEGPGELMALSLLGAIAGDSLLVWDLRLRRFSLWGPDGGFGRTFDAPAAIGLSPVPGGVLADGRAVMLAPDPGATIRLTQSMVFRHQDPLLAVDRDGSDAVPLGDFPSAEVSVFVEGGPFQFPVIFGRRLHFFARGDRIAVGNDDAYSIRVYDAGGALLHVVRQEREPSPVGEGDFDRAVPPLTGALAPRIEGAVAQMPRHPTFPAYQALRIDGPGNLWVQEYRMPEDGGGAVWHVFDRDGVFTGRLELPPDTGVLDAGGDYLLVRARDDLGIERVRLHGLERSPSGG